MSLLLRFDALALRRGGRLLFEGLDLELGPGARLQVTGPNGSGKSSLIRLAAPSLDAQDLLKRKDIGINLAENIDDAARPYTAVEPPAFVNVIRDDSDRLVKRSHSAKT